MPSLQLLAHSRQAVPAGGADVRGLRFAPTALRCSGFQGGRATRLRFAPAQTLPAKSDVEARCARALKALRSSARHHSATGGHRLPLHHRPWRAKRHATNAVAKARAGRPRRVWAAPRSAGGEGLARSATQQLTWPGVSERQRCEGELPGRPAIPSTAGQSERSEDHRRLAPRPARTRLCRLTRSPRLRRPTASKHLCGANPTTPK